MKLNKTLLIRKKSLLLQICGHNRFLRFYLILLLEEHIAMSLDGLICQRKLQSRREGGHLMQSISRRSYRIGNLGFVKPWCSKTLVVQYHWCELHRLCIFITQTSFWAFFRRWGDCLFALMSIYWWLWWSKQQRRAVFYRLQYNFVKSNTYNIPEYKVTSIIWIKVKVESISCYLSELENFWSFRKSERNLFHKIIGS